MKIETTLEQMREDYDWKEAFGYAGKSGNLQGDNSPPEPVLGYTGSVEPFAMEDVEELLGSTDGEPDVRDWVCIGKLKDGRYFTLSAGCDYTGWDCQAGGRAHVASTLMDAIALGLDKQAQERLEIFK